MPIYHGFLMQIVLHNIRMSLSPRKNVGRWISPKIKIAMESNIRIGTWNLCLGLSNKKDLVTSYLNDNSVALCCLQEMEIPMGYPENILNCNNYNLELENNSQKKRVGIYIWKDINYTRRTELEKQDHHVVIIDVEASVKFRIINTNLS